MSNTETQAQLVDEADLPVEHQSTIAAARLEMARKIKDVANDLWVAADRQRHAIAFKINVQDHALDDFDVRECDEWDDRFDDYLDESNGEIDLGAYSYTARDVFNMLDRSTQREVEISVAQGMDPMKFEEYRTRFEALQTLRERYQYEKDRADTLSSILDKVEVLMAGYNDQTGMADPNRSQDA